MKSRFNQGDVPNVCCSLSYMSQNPVLNCRLLILSAMRLGRRDPEGFTRSPEEVDLRLLMGQNPLCLAGWGGPGHDRERAEWLSVASCVYRTVKR